MVILPTIAGPRDLDALSLEQLDELAVGGARVPHPERVAHGRPPGPESRRRRAHDRDPPHLPLARRPDHLRHGPPVLRAQAPDGSPGLLGAAHARRTRRLSAALREPARRRGVLARVELAQLGGRRLARAHPHRSPRPARRRDRRRRRSHGRHDVGGPQQHLRRQQPQSRHRRQRQRSFRMPRRSAAWRATSTACAPPRRTRTSAAHPSPSSASSAPAAARCIAASAAAHTAS